MNVYKMNQLFNEEAQDSNPYSPVATIKLSKKKKKPIQGKDLTVVFQSSLILKISNTFVLLLSIGNHGGVLWPREAMQRDFIYVR